LRFHAEDEITFFYSKFGADLTNMYTVTSCKMKWPYFFGWPDCECTMAFQKAY